MSLMEVLKGEETGPVVQPVEEDVAAALLEARAMLLHHVGQFSVQENLDNIYDTADIFEQDVMATIAMIERALSGLGVDANVLQHELEVRRLEEELMEARNQLDRALQRVGNPDESPELKCEIIDVACRVQDIAEQLGITQVERLDRIAFGKGPGIF